MKKAILSGLFALATFFTTTAQSGINYQAVVRDANGEILENENVNVEFRIISTSTSGTTEYAETQSLNTNAYGNVVAIIGQGTPTLGIFNNIDWEDDDHFLNVQVNGTDMGTTQFMSVPYAKHSETAITATQINEANLKANVTGDGEVIIGNGTSSADLLTVRGESTNGELVDFRINQLNDNNDLVNIQASTATDNSQLLEINANTDRIFAVNGDGSVTREASGNNVDMLPIAYGHVSSNGTLVSGTSNIGTITTTATGQYNIIINGESLSAGDYVVSANTYGNSNNNVSSEFFNNNLNVFVRNVAASASNYANGAFSFIIYKL